MKLLHIIASADPATGGPIEGIGRQHDQTVGFVTRQLATLDHESDPYLKNTRMEIFPLGTPRTGYLPNALGKYRYSPHLVPWLKRNIKSYDAAIVHGLWNYASFAASRVLPYSGTPYFLFSHGMMDPWFKQQNLLKHFAKQMLWSLGEGRLAESARAVLFTTEEERRLAQGQFRGSQYRGEVVPYGTAAPPPDLERQTEALWNRLPELRDKRYLIFLGRIHTKKGCDLLVEAFSRLASTTLSGLHLVVAGPDEIGSVSSLKALAKSLGLDQRVHWPGLLQGDVKWGALRQAEAFVLPSHQENFGIAVAEAMSCATPVLISDKVNIWREVESTGSGLVAPDTLEGTTALLTRWAAMTDAERLLMGNNARETFNQNFDVAAAAPALIDRIRSLI